MKKIGIAFVMLTGIAVSAQEVPKVLKTEFTKEALSQKITNLDGNKLSIAEIIKKHEGRIVIIDFWASWCKDCVLALPGTKELKAENPEIDFVYFSLDRSAEQWKKGMEKFEITSPENYWFDEGWKNPFNNYVDLNWIPRFLIVDQKGKIAKYYSISPSDPEIQKTIDKISKS